MLFLTLLLICLPEAVALPLLLHHRSLSTIHTRQAVHLPLKDREGPSWFWTQSPTLVESRTVQVLETGEALPSDKTFRAWLTAITLSAPSGLCPVCQRQTALFILKVNGEGCACAGCCQQRYSAAGRSQQMGMTLLSRRARKG